MTEEYGLALSDAGRSGRPQKAESLQVDVFRPRPPWCVGALWG
jgi:hypothetical protein